MKHCKECGIKIIEGNAKKHCEDCEANHRKEYNTKHNSKPETKAKKIKWRKENTEKEKRYREDNREKYREYCNRPDVRAKKSTKMKEYHKRPEVKKRQKINGWKSQGIKNMTMEKYNKLLKEQNDCCSICGRHKDEFSRNLYLSVDHDHDIGNPRGLLCGDCNIALGGFKDNIDLLASAVSYMQQY